MKKTSKVIGAVMILVISAMLVSATLLTYFGEVETTMTVSQSILLDGHNWDEPVTHQFEATGGCCYCFEHSIGNQGCEGIWLDWQHSGNPDLEGIDVYIIPKCYLVQLDINVLDGMAQYDDFEVYVDGTLVYTYYANGGSENWIMHSIDLSPYNIPCYGTHTVTVDCIAGSPWTYWQTYGQLGVDEMTLYCCSPEGPVVCDYVDIGDSTSEAGHNLQSWGPIEPATSGGTWGSIDDCRVTWSPTENPVTTWASVDLTCEFCQCDCDKEPMELPFYIEPEEMIEFCICYKLDMLIAPGTYTITSTLVPATVL